MTPRRFLIGAALAAMMAPAAAMAGACPGFGPNGEGVELAYTEGTTVRVWPGFNAGSMAEGRDAEGALLYRQETIGWMHPVRLRQGEDETAFQYAPDPVTILPLEPGRVEQFTVSVQKGNAALGLRPPTRYRQSVEVTEAGALTLPGGCLYDALIAQQSNDATGRFVRVWLVVIPALRLVLTGAPQPLTLAEVEAGPLPTVTQIGRRKR